MAIIKCSLYNVQGVHVYFDTYLPSLLLRIEENVKYESCLVLLKPSEYVIKINKKQLKSKENMATLFFFNGTPCVFLKIHNLLELLIPNIYNMSIFPLAVSEIFTFKYRKRYSQNT